MGRPQLSLGCYGKIRIYPHADGYRAMTSYRDYDGVTRQVERHAKTKGAAERTLAEALRDRARLGGAAEIKPDTKVVLLADAWWKEVEASDRSPGTLRLYRDRLDRQVIPSLGNLRVRELTTGMIDRHLRAVTEKNGPGTAKATRSVLSGMCMLAARHDALDRNPVRDAGTIKKPKAKEPKALSIEEAKQLRAALTYDDQAIERDLPDLVDMMLATGLRIGKVTAIDWDAVDLEAGSVEVRGIVVRVRGRGLIVKNDPSSKLTKRALDLPGWAAEMLRSRATGISTTAVGNSPLFPAPHGGLRDPSNTQADLRDAFKKAGVEITSHALRKTVATMMDQAGLTARAAADQLGHSKPSMTSDVYFGRRMAPTGAAEVLEALG